MNAELRGLRVTVMGLGRFGGGLGVTRYLLKRGARVLVTDAQSATDLGLSADDLGDLQRAGDCDLRLGGHDEADFTDCDLVVANPAVPRPWKDPWLGAATAAGIPITTEIRLLTERVDRRRTIGVTGTAGKSTTAAMIHHIFKKARRHEGTKARSEVHLGGNIGGSLLGELDRVGPDDWIVLELSSAMLHWLGAGAGAPGAAGWSPRVAVMTNLQPNHLDWHETFEHYRSSKQHLFAFQQSGDHALTAPATRAGTPPRLSIPGRHNQLNARLAVAAACTATGMDEHAAAEALSDFPGLPHRLQLVAERDGLRFYNDSKSTTPAAARLAVEAFEDARTVHLVAGGYDKGIDLAEISDMAPSLAGLYTIGATGMQLAAAATGHAQYCDSLDVAVHRAHARMRPGHILLLSPGCASWDQFTNYEQRGEAFCELVTSTAGLTLASWHRGTVASWQKKE